MPKRTVILVSLAVVLIAGIVTVSVFTRADVKHGMPLTVQLQWEPSAQFLGFYAAKEEGFYADAKLNVQFLHGGPNVNPIANVINGNAGVGLATADQVLRWNDKNPDQLLRAVGTVYDRSLAVFMVRADSGIEGPEDFAGKRIGVFPSYDTESLMILLLRKVGLTPKDVIQVNFPNFANFENQDIDAYGAYIINEPELAALRNIPVRLIDPQRWGIHFYSDTVIVRDDYLKAHRDLVENFLVGSIRGWQFAENHIDAALSDMRTDVGGVFGAGEPWQHQEKSAHVAIRYVRGGARNLFTMRKGTWKELESDLREIGVLSTPNLVEKTCNFELAGAANDQAWKR